MATAGTAMAGAHSRRPQRVASPSPICNCSMARFWLHLSVELRTNAEVL